MIALPHSNRRIPAIGAALLWLSLLCACSDPDSEGSPKDPAQTVFDPQHLLQVKIQMDPGQWDSLRQEGRHLTTVFGGCADPNFEYTYFKGSVTVDGVKVADVGIRKKGFLGSLSVVRPALKLKFGHYVAGQKLFGLKRMTLNNNRQDPALARQCLSYSLFKAAGVAAPRCNYARVWVNHKDLGIYTHVESIKKDFLVSRFADQGEGNLYEGAISDFSDGFTKTFEVKTNASTNDRSDLLALTKALEAADDKLLSALTPLVDVDAFISFWATEVLVGHWDSYSGNLNNFYTYHDKVRDKFYFIPWGTDGSFKEEHSLNKAKIPASVYAWGMLARRLYLLPQTRDKYRQRLLELLNTVWKEESLLAEINRVEAMAYEGGFPSYAKDEASQLRGFISNRRAVLLKELQGSPPQWDQPPRTAPYCWSKGVAVSGTFATTWGSLDYPQKAPALKLDITVSGQQPLFHTLMAAAGTDKNVSGEVGGEVPLVRLMGFEADGTGIITQLIIEPSQFLDNTDAAFHGFETFGVVLRYKSSTDIEMIGFIGKGSVKLDKASMTYGQPVSGKYSGIFLQTTM